MFIKVNRAYDGEPVLVNADAVSIITEHRTPDKTYCCLTYRDTEEFINVSQCLAELELLLDVNSTERQIEKVKRESAQLQHQQFAMNEIQKLIDHA